MASKISKKFCAVRFQSRSAAALATSAKREVPRANGRAAAGSAADFYGNAYFLRIQIFMRKPPSANCKTLTKR